MNPDATYPTLPLDIHHDAAARIRVASFTLEPVLTGERPTGLDAELATLEAEYAARWKQPADAIDALRPARTLYHAFGIDPSKTRPSSEALLRRVLQGKGLYRVNAVVDAANLASLAILLPVGLYDSARIRGPVMLRVGGEGEGYEGIRKDRVNVAGRPTLVDTEGPFGNPTSDSLRTSVTAQTRSVWFVIFAPAETREEELRRRLDRAHGILERHAKG